MVRSQIGNLTPDRAFGHNLCFNYPNGSCEPILNICVPRDFQWYKEFYNPMGFDPYNHSLKIQKSIWTQTPKVGVHLGVWRCIPSHSFTFLGAWMWLSGFILNLHLRKPLPWSRAQGLGYDTLPLQQPKKKLKQLQWPMFSWLYNSKKI